MVYVYGVAIEPGNYTSDSRFLSTAPYHTAQEKNPREIVIYPMGKCLHPHYE